MFNKTIPFSRERIDLATKEGIHVVFKQEPVDNSTCYLRIRCLCLNCWQSHYVKSKVYDPKEVAMDYHYPIREALNTCGSIYECPHCWKEHNFFSESMINELDSSFRISERSNFACLSDLTEETKVFLKENNPRQFKKMETLQSGGYQWVRYSSEIVFNPETLEIEHSELNWDRIYICLEHVGEIAYKRVGQKDEFRKIANKSVFADYDSYNRTYLMLETSEDASFLNRTGLPTFISKLHHIYFSYALNYKLVHFYGYEQMRQIFPGVEQLVKASYETLIYQLLDTRASSLIYHRHEAGNILNPIGSTPSQILGYSKGVLNRLKKLGVFEDMKLAYAFKVLDLQHPITTAFLDALDPGFELKDISENIEIFQQLINQGYDYEELIHYTQRIWVTNATPSNETWELLRDYISMAQQMNLDFEKFPRYVRVAHDLMQRNFKYQEDALVQQQFEEKSKQKSYLEYSPDDENFMITIPTNPEQLVKEGSALNHCVASYIQRMAKGDTLILFLREKESPTKSYITIEWCNNRVVQARGFRNTSIANYPEANEFLNKWVTYVKSLEATQTA